MAHEDVAGTIQYTRQALDHIPEDDHLRRGIPASLLGLASWANGDLELAVRSLDDAMSSFEKAGNILFSITGAYVLAEIKSAQGLLQEAFQTYQKSLQLAAGQGDLVLRGTADIHTGLSELHREWNDLDSATQHLQASQELGEQAALPHWHHRWCLAQARMKQSQGDLESALDLFEQAERAYIRGPVPDVRPIAAMKARTWVAKGRLALALKWARQRGLSVNAELNYLSEYEFITLARLLISEYRGQHHGQALLDALRLLRRLLNDAQAGKRLASVIEILILQALAHEARKDLPMALLSLDRALTLAEPQGYRRIFLDEGAPMARLLSAARARGMQPAFCTRLLAGFENPAQVGEDKAILHPAQPLIDPLSRRELEILELIARGFSNHEISQRLFIALNTVKGHNRKIYGKLQVQRRTEAVARARELGLLSPV